jgi:hypothetical protein
MTMPLDEFQEYGKLLVKDRQNKRDAELEASSQRGSGNKSMVGRSL